MHFGPQLVTNAEQAQFIIAPFQLAAKVVEYGLELFVEYFADFSKHALFYDLTLAYNFVITFYC